VCHVVSKRVAPGHASFNGAAYELALEYDADNRLAHAIRTTATHRISARYFYDAYSRRIAKRVAKEEQGRHDSPAPSKVTSLFVWDGDLMVQELGGDKTVTYVYEPESFVPLARIASARDGDGDGMGLPEVPEWRAPGWRAKKAPDSPIVEHGKDARPSADTDTEPDDDRIEYFHCDHLGTPRGCSTARATSSGAAGSGHGAGRATKSQHRHR
jgi:YD repeat-containing protein